MNPREPYNTTGELSICRGSYHNLMASNCSFIHIIVLINNYFGRQFSSLNDIGINPRNKDVYFTDTLYGYLQEFRPAPGLRNQVYRLNDKTGAVTVVADGFTLPNGNPPGTTMII